MKLNSSELPTIDENVEMFLRDLSSMVSTYYHALLSANIPADLAYILTQDLHLKLISFIGLPKND